MKIKLEKVVNLELIRIYKIFTWLLLISVFLTPFFAYYNFHPLASFFYNAFAFFDHQYPYRSYALFPATNEIGNCIQQNDSYVFTFYTKIFTKPYNGTFVYDRKDIGSIRAEICTKKLNNEVIIGYKFPVCARDIGIYLGMALTTLLISGKRKRDKKILDEIQPIYVFFLFIPMAFDGFGQLAGFWESTNELRLLTGTLSGVAVSLIMMKVFYE